MALFGKDRDRSDRDRHERDRIERDRNERPRILGPEPGVAAPEPAPREVEMFGERERERERLQTQPEETGTGTTAFLGKGCRVTGKLVFEGAVRIEGKVEGEITAQSTLTIGETADINAQIHGTSIVVNGKVQGDITARKRLEIRAPGKVFGNISTPSLVISEGVVFEGQCTMGGADAAKGEKDRKVTFLNKDERPGEAAPVAARSDVAK